MPDLPPQLDRYREKSPYAVLGIDNSDADAKEVRDTFNGLKRDLQEKALAPAERARRTQELEDAYERLRTPAGRVGVDFFVLDRNLGRKQCEAVAEQLPKPNTEVAGVIKPRNIRVTHETLYDELPEFLTDPPKVGGLFPVPMDVGGPDLPDLLAVRFDC